MHCGFAIAETESAADAEGEAAAWKLQEILQEAEHPGMDRSETGGQQKLPCS